MIFEAYTDLRQELKTTISSLHSLFIDYGISREREYAFTRNCFEQLPFITIYDEGSPHHVEVESVDWDYAYVVEGKYHKYEVLLSELSPSDLETIAYKITQIQLY